ncbi:MAG: LapA family protein [Nitrospinota bacterium]
MTPSKLIIWMIILIAIGAFSVQNLQTIELKYYNFKFELKTILTPLVVVLLGSLFGGFFLASLFGMVNNIRLKNIIRKQNHTIKNLDQKIAKITLNSSQPSEEQK